MADPLQDGPQGTGVVHVAVGDHHGRELGRVQPQELQVVEHGHPAVTGVQKDRGLHPAPEDIQPETEPVLGQKGVLEHPSAPAVGGPDHPLPLLQEQVGVVVDHGGDLQAVDGFQIHCGAAHPASRVKN